MAELSGVRLPRFETRTNARLKLYPFFYVHQVSNSDIFSRGDFETSDGKPFRPYVVPSKGNAKDPERSHYESRRRAVSAVRDIALCNIFEYMFTWTLDGSLIDRYDSKEIYKKVRSFLTHASSRKGFKYVLIPEYHKQKEGEDNPAIHMHGLCCLGSVQISPSGLNDKSGRPIFNMVDWNWGFSTCVPLDLNYKRAVNYVTKYITETEVKIFGKWYLSSRNLLKRPDIVPLDGEIFEEFRDEEKLADKRQIERTVYAGVKIVSEEFHG